MHRRDRAVARSLPRAARIGYHPGTNRVRFLTGTPSRPLGAGLAVVVAGKRQLTTADAKLRAQRFLDRYGGLFGLADPADELRSRGARRFTDPPAGERGAARPAAAEEPSRVVVRLEQTRSGIPVMGGQLLVQVSGRGEVLSVAGEVMPSSTTADPRPRLSAVRASQVARAWLARRAGRPRADVSVHSEGLAWYDPRIMEDPAPSPWGTRLVWRIDARLPATRGVPEEHRLVVVDAHGGQIVIVHRPHLWPGPGHLRQRAPGGAVLQVRRPLRPQRGPGHAPGSADVDAAYRLMGVVDDYFATRFGRAGIDGQGGRMRATVRYCGSAGCPWRNAEWKWAEQQAIFGSGWARADDIVAHEFVHGILDAEAPLFYHYQSGAINEALADIFGELIDLSYAGGTDTAATAWRIGEDTPIGAFRDMRDPGRFGDPDRVRSPRWHVGSGDDGGVHRNSGVANKAASLLADGGTFGGRDIAAIGRPRTARIFYQALTTRLTPAANYIDLADALLAACTDLAGDGDITMAHCTSVRDATRATQMHLQPKRMAPRRAPICGPGRRPVDVYVDDLENPAAGLWQPERLRGQETRLVLPAEPQQRPVLGWHLGLERPVQPLRPEPRQRLGYGHARATGAPHPRAWPSCASSTATPSMPTDDGATTAASSRSRWAAARGAA